MFLFRHAGEVSKKVHLFGLTRKLLDIYIIVISPDILSVFLKFFKISFFPLKSHDNLVKTYFQYLYFARLYRKSQEKRFTFSGNNTQRGSR